MTGNIFYIAHRTNGRTRIRWAGKPEHRHRASEIAGQLNDIESVESAVARLTTGSIIIEHPSIDWLQLKQRLQQHAAIEFSDRPQSTPSRTGVDALGHQLNSLNALLKREAGQQTDLSSLTVSLLLILAIVQAARGQVMGSAASFMWYALNIATRNMNRDRPSNPDSVDD